jgi:hypothetical protein
MIKNDGIPSLPDDPTSSDHEFLENGMAKDYSCLNNHV